MGARTDWPPPSAGGNLARQVTWPGEIRSSQRARLPQPPPRPGQLPDFSFGTAAGGLSAVDVGEAPASRPKAPFPYR